MKKIFWAVVLLLLFSSCGERNIATQPNNESGQNSVVITEGENPAEVIEDTDSVPAPTHDVISADNSTESSESDNLNFQEEAEIVEEESVLDPTLEVELNDLYEAAVDWGYTKNWETVFSENHYLMCCTDTEGRELFREQDVYNKHRFFSESDVVTNRQCIAWLYFGRKFGEVSPGQILEDLLRISPSPVAFYEESIFDCYEKGYYEFSYKGDVYCFMKRDYHFDYMQDGEMDEYTDVLIRMEGEEIPIGQIEAVSENLPSNEMDGQYVNIGFCDDILNYLDDQILADSLALLDRNIQEIAENGIIMQVRSNGSTTYCQFEGMDIKMNGGEDGDIVFDVCIPMAVIFTGDENWDYNGIKENIVGGFSFEWDNSLNRQNPYLFNFYTSNGILIQLSANSDTTLDMNGWCAIR